MGREWLHWIAGGGVRRPSTTRRRRLPAAESEGTNSSAGCMCAVFQLFDLQHHPFTYPPDGPFLQEEATTSKGVEAPRNSLEMEEPASMKAASSMSLATKEEENSNFPVGINQIKTRVVTKSITEDNISSDCSPGTIKTPNLVARLMGLDLLPECNNSPSSSCPNSKSQTESHIFNQKTRTHILHNRSKTFSDDDIAVGAHSSSARISDFEYHRLSLQINKENKNEEFAISAKTRGKSAKSRQDHENTSPAGHFAKQFVNQVKEKVGRKVGLIDITNTDHRDKEEIIRRDQHLVIHQPTKKNNSSILPKKKIVTSSGTKSARSSTSSCHESSNYDQSRGILKDGKKIGGGNRNISSGMKKLQFAPQTCNYSIGNKKPESFVRPDAENKANNLTDKKKKMMKTKKLAPLMSSEILNISAPTLLPVKKDPSPPATKLPQKQQQGSDAPSSKRNTQLSCNSSRSYKHLSLQPDQISTVLPNKNNGCATTASAATSAAAYRYYVQKILKCAGINDKLTPLTLGKWHTASNPLEPSIFYYLELFDSGGATAALSLRCSRKLIFQLVDELLAEILKPHLDFKPWIDSSLPVVGIGQSGLCDELCRRIGDFPAADCRVLEDIDSLVERDLGELRLNGFFEEEGELLVCEIEGEITEWLVRETVAVVGGCARRSEEEKQTENQL